MKHHFNRVPVKKRSITMSYTETDNRRTESLTIDKHSFKNTLFIPTYPAINPETIFNLIQECYRRKSPHSTTIGLYILTQLQRKEQRGTVEIEQKELIDFLGVSAGTVNKAVKTLEELNIIAKVGKSSWKVSPKFAWVGSHVEWAEQLLSIDTGITNSVEVRTVSIEEV